MRVAAIQHDIAWCDREANFAHIAPLIAGAAGAGARLILLSETFSTGFATDREDLGEPERGPSSQFLAEQARQHNVWIAGSCPEIAADAPPDDQRPYNTLVLAAPDGEQHRYRKIHPFTYGGETKYFNAGDQFVTVDVEGLRVSLFVCYDLRFADEFWQLADATDVYLVPANWPEARRLPWMALLQSGRSRTWRTSSAATASAAATDCRTAAIADHRSAGRDPGHRGAEREHPARRHQCRARRRGSRPVPLPARPPIALVVAATVPDLMLGCWKRAWIEFADGTRDDTTTVVWLQTESLMADVRIATDRGTFGVAGSW
jgi:predicted amidohydrolase